MNWEKSNHPREREKKKKKGKEQNGAAHSFVVLFTLHFTQDNCVYTQKCADLHRIKVENILCGP